MKKIQFYGEDEFTESEPISPEEIFPPEELPPEKKSFYKKFRILDFVAIILCLLLVAEGFILKATRMYFDDESRMNMSFLFIEAITVALGIGIFLAYRYINHSLTTQNMAVIIVTECVLATGEFLLYSFCVPVLFWILVALSGAFIIYAITKLNCRVIFRLAICLVLIFVLNNANFVCLHSFEFTPRYIYFANSGYNDKSSDESNIYYAGKIDETYFGTNDGFDYIYSTEQKRNSMEELKNVIEQISSIGSMATSVDELKNWSDKVSDIVPLDKIFSIMNRYDDEFFKSNMLAISVIELKNKNDTIEVTDIQYSEKYSKTYLNYHKSHKETDKGDKAVCVILYEIPQDVALNIFQSIFGYSTRNAEITYIDK